jgi:hypothetical protein
MTVVTMNIRSLAGAVRAPLVALALFGAVVPAAAQQPSANAIAMAKEIIALKGSAAGYNTVVSSLIERLKTMLLQTNPMLGKDLNEVAAKLKTDYTAKSAEPLNDAAKLYARRFTEPELKQVLTFYKTPAGAKVIREEPAIFEESMNALEDWSQTLSEEILPKFRAEMKKRGHDV